jgi:hypothetical protein
MASELSRLIEQELEKQGFHEGGGRAEDVERQEADETVPLVQGHSALMGALRVEVSIQVQGAT